MSVVWKEETVVFVRDRVRVERTALGIAGGQNKVVEAVQDEASPTTLPGESPEAKNLLLGEGQSRLLRAHCDADIATGSDPPCRLFFCFLHKKNVSGLLRRRGAIGAAAARCKPACVASLHQPHYSGPHVYDEAARAGAARDAYAGAVAGSVHARAVHEPEREEAKQGAWPTATHDRIYRYIQCVFSTCRFFS